MTRRTLFVHFPGVCKKSDSSIQAEGMHLSDFKAPRPCQLVRLLEAPSGVGNSLGSCLCHAHKKYTEQGLYGFR